MLSKNFTQKFVHKTQNKIETEEYDDFYEWIEHSSILGRRQTNEDAFVSFDYDKYQIAGLFDGHNGRSVSDICQRSLQQCFTSSLKMYGSNLNNLQQQSQYNDSMLKILIQTVKMLEEKCIQQKILDSGSTAVIVMMDQSNNKINIANVGDSCCIVGYCNTQTNQNKNNKQNSPVPIEQLKQIYYETIVQQFVTTKPHKPTDQDEQERILKAGGEIIDVHDVPRVDGKLAVSRAIGNLGDKTLKTHGVISTPDIYNLSFEHVQFVMLSCDGLTDVLSPKQINACINTAIFLRKYRHSLRNLPFNHQCNNRHTHEMNNISKAIINIFFEHLEQDLAKQTQEVQELVPIIKQFIQHFLNLSPSVNTIQIENKETQVFENVQPNASLQLRIAQALTKFAYFLDSKDNVSVGIAILDKIA